MSSNPVQDQVSGRYRSLHYDSVHGSVVEPLDRIDLQPLPANPGGANTLWQSSVTGHMVLPPVDVSTLSNDNSQNDLVAWNPTSKSLVYRTVTSLPTGGSGTVTGPGTTVVGDVATWNNTTGTVLADSGVLLSTLTVGPASATNNDIAVYNGTSGKLIKDSGVTVASITPNSQTVIGPVSTTSGDLVTWNNATGTLTADSGVLATNVVTGPVSATTTNLASYNGTTGKIIQDSGILAANVVTGPASATTTNLASYNGTSGKIIQDSGILAANVVTGPASATTTNLASYNGTSGKIIQDSGILAANVVTGPASAVTARIATFNGTSGKIIQDGGSTIASITPNAQTVIGPATTTSGNVVSWNNTTGTLVADSTKVTTSLVTGPASAVTTNLASYNGTTGKIIQDSGILAGNVMQSTVPGASVTGDIVTWSDTGGINAADSTVNVSIGGSVTVAGPAGTPFVLSVPRNAAGTNGSSMTIQSGGGASAASNKNAGDLVLQTGIATGTKRGNVRIQQSVGSVTSGTTDNTVTDRMVFAGRQVITSGVTTTVVTPTVAASAACSVVIKYGILVTGSGDVQSETNTISIAMVNKAGTFTSSVQSGTAVQALSAGTLTTSFTVTAAGVIQVASTTNLASPTMSIVYDVDNMSSSVITFL